jgi:elongation factor Ts
MTITASLVKDLRDRTGAGMMECKKALQETNGDIEAAVEHMRKTGLAKADKKAGRIAAEGMVAVETSEDGKHAVLVEVNSETDFVAKGDDFQNFARDVAKVALEQAPADLDALMAAKMKSGKTVNDARQELIAKIGENVQVRRLARIDTDYSINSYLHGARIGVLIDVKDGDEELSRDLAMHIAASRPVCVNAKDVPAELLEKEKEIFTAQAQESGKPADIIEKMVEGRLRKFLAEVTLLGQPFVKDPDMSVEKLLKSKGAEVVQFVRMEVGEGIEKKTENFADEVMAQVKG